jgi:hypothetical protein
MSNSTNLNRMNWIISVLWDAEIQTRDLNLADTLIQVRHLLNSIKEDMVKERNERIARMIRDGLRGEIGTQTNG